MGIWIDFINGFFWVITYFGAVMLFFYICRVVGGGQEEARVRRKLLSGSGGCGAFDVF